MASLPKGSIGAEIGVAEGCFSEVLLEVCKPEALYLIDPWVHLTDPALQEDSGNVSQECHESKYAQVIKRFRSKGQVRIWRVYSLAAAICFPKHYFGWVYIDADHTQAGKDAEAWWPRIKPGGYLCGHDYAMVGDWLTVKAQIDEFVAKHKLELFVTRGDTDIFEKNYPSRCIQKPPA